MIAQNVFRSQKNLADIKRIGSKNKKVRKSEKNRDILRKQENFFTGKPVAGFFDLL